MVLNSKVRTKWIMYRVIQHVSDTSDYLLYVTCSQLGDNATLDYDAIKLYCFFDGHWYSMNSTCLSWLQVACNFKCIWISNERFKKTKEIMANSNSDIITISWFSFLNHYKSMLQCLYEQDQKDSRRAGSESEKVRQLKTLRIRGSSALIQHFIFFLWVRKSISSKANLLRLRMRWRISSRPR